MWSLKRKAQIVCLAALTLSGCVAGGEVTRVANVQQIALPGIADQLTRRFMAETPYAVTFSGTGWELSQTTREHLDVQADWILRNPVSIVQVFGQAATGDEAGFGNMRALEVADFLKMKGVDPERIQVLSTLGSLLPAGLSGSAEGRVITLVYGEDEVAQSDVRKPLSSLRQKVKPDTDTNEPEDEERCPRIVEVCLDGEFAAD